MIELYITAQEVFLIVGLPTAKRKAFLTKSLMFLTQI